MRYQKELRKIIILLAIGVGLALFGVIGASVKSGIGEVFDILFDLDTLFTLLCVTLYPLGVFYNWRRMFGIATEEEVHTPADRYYTVKERNMHHSMNLSGRIMRFAIIMTIGWIPGVYFAIKKLNYLKKNQL